MGEAQARGASQVLTVSDPAVSSSAEARGCPTILQARGEGSECHRNGRPGQLRNVWGPGQKEKAGPLVQVFPSLHGLCSCRVF